jgi:cell division protein FtsI (penicillin-binding protein 3)
MSRRSQDGYDVISTLDVYTRYLHHALLKQLEEYGAEHGCVVVIGKTGHVKAISNLGRDEKIG